MEVNKFESTIIYKNELRLFINVYICVNRFMFQILSNYEY
jgi:hypothetical protein